MIEGGCKGWVARVRVFTSPAPFRRAPDATCGRRSWDEPRRRSHMGLPVAQVSPAQCPQSFSGSVFQHHAARSESGNTTTPTQKQPLPAPPTPATKPGAEGPPGTSCHTLSSIRWLSSQKTQETAPLHDSRQCSSQAAPAPDLPVGSLFPELTVFPKATPQRCYASFDFGLGGGCSIDCCARSVLKNPCLNHGDTEDTIGFKLKSLDSLCSPCLRGKILGLFQQQPSGPSFSPNKLGAPNHTPPLDTLPKT